MTERQRLQILLQAIQSLKEINLTVPIVVEGKRDLRALRSLGFRGEIILLHRGKPIYEFSESLLQRASSFVLLLDWDPKGQQLYQRLKDLLHGHFEEFSPLRDQIISAAEEEIHEVEAIPLLIEKLSRT